MELQALLQQPLKTCPATLHGRQIRVVERGTFHWELVQAIGEQVLEALNDLGFVRTDGLGETRGFNLSELAISPDGRYVVVQLDVSSIRQVYQPTAGKAGGKPRAFVALTDAEVLEQIRIRVSALLGGKCEVKVDNHYWVRWIADLGSVGAVTAPPQGALGVYLPTLAATSPFTLPLGLTASGRLLTANLVESGRHVILTGTTGQGKSNWVWGALFTLLQRADPAQHPFNLVFFDPQRVTFGPFADQLPAAYRFTDHEGALGMAVTAVDSVAYMARLNREQHWRLQLLHTAGYATIEEYNAHVSPQERLPYLFVFLEEMTMLQNSMLLTELAEDAGDTEIKAALTRGKQQWQRFQVDFKSLLSGSRKVGFRFVVALQYLRADLGLDMHEAAQLGLKLAFWNSPQGSQNVLGDRAATLIPEKGRFIVEGIPEAAASKTGRLTLQALYTDAAWLREQLAQLSHTRRTYPVDPLVLEILGYALSRLDGNLMRDQLAEAFTSVTSRRQIENLLVALEQLGLVTPANIHEFEKQPRRLAVATLDEVLEVLQYHPEISFREETGRLVFGISR